MTHLAFFGLAAGLVHPYLAAMVFALVSATAARRLLAGGTMAGRMLKAVQSVLGFVAGMILVADHFLDLLPGLRWPRVQSTSMH